MLANRYIHMPVATALHSMDKLTGWMLLIQDACFVDPCKHIKEIGMIG